ncbi:MAG: hypothetical protein RSE12_14510 [Fuscovulum sp.]|nr:MAG: hypothetical protein RSE12_14510 [Fuscovulum sp.]
MPDIRTAMTDPKLFGLELGGESFAAWRALLCGFYGLSLTEDEAAIWQEITRREELPTEAHDELWLAVGRRGGKSRAAALVAVFEAVFMDHRPKLAPGEVATVMLIAGDQKQARSLIRYVKGFLENPMLAREVTRYTDTIIEFANRSVIEIATASFRSVRGYTLAAVVGDEIAFWQSEGANPDEEVVAALRPALATLNGKLLAISSPHSKRGALWNAYRRHFGKAGRVLVAQAPSRTMNPQLAEKVVADAMEQDPARASAEYLAQFRSDLEAFLGIEAINAAQREKPLELPREPGVQYVAFADPSGGGPDAFTLAIAHREGQAAVVDLVRGRRGDPAASVEDFAEVLRAYGVNRVSGDKYAGQWVANEFRRHGIIYEPTAKDRSAIYVDFLSAMNAGRVELSPCPITARELAGLERRTTRGGKDIIDHAPGGHDDHANAAAGAVALLAGARAHGAKSFELFL